MRALMMLVVLVAITGNAQAQSRGRHQVYAPYYNGYGQQPGLSVYRGGYSVDYYGGSKSYRWGYQPPRSQVYRRYNAYNGLTPSPWMFYYNGMEYSPYNIYSPIW